MQEDGYPLVFRVSDTKDAQDEPGGIEASLVRHQLLQPRVLPLEFLEPLRLVEAQAAVPG